MVLETDLTRKERRLRDSIRSLGRCIVAFSGGIDSALVLHVASQELGEDAIGITGSSPSLAERERSGAAAFAGGTGARHEFIPTAELEDPNYAANPANRCYFCKRELYGKLAEIARERGATAVLDGFNLDDLADRRPGRAAAAEYGIRSPLADSGFTKADVRGLARRLGLEIWDKPALACLSSRFPQGTEITLDLLRQVDRAEQAIHDAGLRACRVRHHGEIARIEVPLDDVPLIIEPERREAIVRGVRAAGYRHVTLDLGGYVRGGA